MKPSINILHITILFLLSITQTTAASPPLTITYSGSSSSSSTPAYMGIGSGHALETSNYLQWMQYLGPNAVRYFATSVFNWKNFITSRSSSAWGTSFNNIPITTQDTWTAAVQHLRSSSSSPGSLPFFDWLIKDQSIRWSQFITILNSTNTDSALLQCLGNPTNIINGITKQLNARPLVIWHVTCSNFKLSSTDKSTAEYWKERWELYRWFYLGGRFLSDMGVEDIELYNEPDKEECLTPTFWIDELSIRSLALQDAYTDHSSRTGQTITPTLIAPPMSAPRYDNGSTPYSYGQIAMKNANTKFPSGTNDPNWRNFKEYSYHQYNSPGYGMRSAYDKLRAALNQDNNNIPVRITEHNCYSAGVAEKVKGDVMNSPATAACLANQVATMIGRVPYMSVQKFSQSAYSTGKSGVAKNGLFWADLGENDVEGACNVGGSTKSGEAYRLLLRRSPGSKQLYDAVVQPPLPKLSNYSTYTVADDVAYYIYSINAQPGSQSLIFDVTKLAGVNANAPVSVTVVSSKLHGEQAPPTTVTATPTSKKISISQSGQSVYMLTVPRTTTSTKSFITISDTSVTASNPTSSEGSASPQLPVSTSRTSPPTVSLVKFDLLNSIPNKSKIVSASLQLTVSSFSSNSQHPHTVTVYGVDSNAPWNEQTANWNVLSDFLLPAPKNTASIETNFINWYSLNAPQVVGHGTVSSVGQVVSVDVTDYLKKSTSDQISFLIARLVRFDQRGRGVLSSDDVSGGVAFNSKESSNGDGSKPTLQIVFASTR